MHTLTKWCPYDTRNRLSHYAPHSHHKGDCQSFANPEWMPAADIAENDSEYVIEVELPGFKRSEVAVTLENRVLTITGERRFAEKEMKIHRSERSYGKFMRSFAVPEATEKIDAELRDGLLILRIVKSEQAKPKRIAVTG